MVDAFLKQMNITIIPFGKDEAAIRSIGNWDFSENTRDYTIGATAIKLDVELVTNNTKHFNWMENVSTPNDVMGLTISQPFLLLFLIIINPKKIF